ncbi:MAG: hypothetical protein RIS54_920 [Verrucomicrobiota bacterium]
MNGIPLRVTVRSKSRKWHFPKKLRVQKNRADLPLTRAAGSRFSLPSLNRGPTVLAGPTGNPERWQSGLSRSLGKRV